jgi:hypothetical protein
MAHEAGKGGKRRKEDRKKVSDNWEGPFGMRLCPECGNKRCPKATYRSLACTGSNEPGQKGSRYEDCT